ncbi:MAG: hypothetical protein JNJ83_04950 [Verrucomicrobiaceae bacterium]|nr:hypothetical protein [Verrucomicrobiaceae bacterium]
MEEDWWPGLGLSRLAEVDGKKMGGKNIFLPFIFLPIGIGVVRSGVSHCRILVDGQRLDDAKGAWDH